MKVNKTSIARTYGAKSYRFDIVSAFRDAAQGPARRAGCVLLPAWLGHPFGVIKRQFGHVNVRYCGLAKNTAQLHTLFALSNLWMCAANWADSRPESACEARNPPDRQRMNAQMPRYWRQVMPPASRNRFNLHRAHPTVLRADLLCPIDA